MSIVNRETLGYIKEKRNRAYSENYWEQKYHQAMRGLESAVALLEQIDHTTDGLTVETKITLKKE